MKQMLMQLCQSADIPYKLDIYPYYGSDVGPMWRSGADVVAGLIGPGVDASHHYERTHVDALIATVRLIIEFMLA
jgi:putative aminopeptidase FrvX